MNRTIQASSCTVTAWRVQHALGPAGREARKSPGHEVGIPARPDTRGGRALALQHKLTNQLPGVLDAVANPALPPWHVLVLEAPGHDAEVPGRAWPSCEARGGE